MSIHIKNRDRLVMSLREELVGPSPQGEEIDCFEAIVFEDTKQFYRPWRQKDSMEEILQRDPPCRRYGVGVLFPRGHFTDDDIYSVNTGESIIDQTEQSDIEAGTGIYNEIDTGTDENVLSNEANECLDSITRRTRTGSESSDQDDFDLSAANKYKQSSIGVSFLSDFPETSILRVEVPTQTGEAGNLVNGRYRKKTVLVAGKERNWWLRSPVKITAEYSSIDVCNADRIIVPASRYDTENLEGMEIHVEVFSRPHSPGNKRLITVCLVNRKAAASLKNEECLFQAYFRVSVITADGNAQIQPYPRSTFSEMDIEEQSLALLYRNAETFAVGHGCAAGWGETSGDGKVLWVSGECLPEVEIPSITPDITRNDGTPVKISMAALAGLVEGDNGFDSLSELINLYENWIVEREAEISLLEAYYQPAARLHVDECKRCLSRMKEGFKFLQDNVLSQRAFQLANHAILLQQVRNRREPRWAQYSVKEKRLIFSEPYMPPDVLNTGNEKGMWRAFQAAFLLMTVKSTAQDDEQDRETIDLIWFPTGGGKTEAYLGLAAYSVFLRRLVDKQDDGVQVLMRYTLRLLTAQQFLRAAGLLCAMEYLRRESNQDLGDKEFSIGLWLGGETTPNTRKDALDTLKGLQKGGKGTRNKFVLNRCPWCGAQIGPIKTKKSKPKDSRTKGYATPGYEIIRETVAFACSDNKCLFLHELPVYVIDEDIYDKKPSLIIGTIDKFAMLAWRPEARSIFGINPEGERECSPPGLIIQDELHLISGPLGSMAGLYETVIEELCTDRRKGKTVTPKIVCSTATIRRYEDQVKALYGRQDTALFPPPGLDAGDSFYGRYAIEADGTLCPGKKYIGVHAPGLGSMQTVQVRTFTSLLQEPVNLNDNERDPWWTLLIFFNSLRELGTTLTLFQSDIPAYLTVIKNRKGLNYAELRKLNNINELTGRLREDEIPESISALEVSCEPSESYPVDVCLASNIIEVGIDIDRLSLMTVVGQPKTTSQYIQVTGRVGRKWWERPGLVVTLYSASKPRDRSHFEKFRSYHERLYAQVEPTSVTPFSPPVLDRALHAVMATYARQKGDQATAGSPYPFPGQLIDQLRKILIPRVKRVDPEELTNFERVFQKRKEEWERWERTCWDEQGSDIPLLRVAGNYVSRARALISWPTQMSMRNVDAQCQAEITRHYLNEDGETNA